MFAYPEGCDAQEEDDCDYVAKWARHGDFVKFRVVHRIGDGKWTAIGMSENPFMVGGAMK